MITLIIIFIVYLVSALYLDYDIRKTDGCSLWDFLTDTGDVDIKHKIFPVLILIITLPILAIWAFTESKPDNES